MTEADEKLKEVFGPDHKQGLPVKLPPYVPIQKKTVAIFMNRKPDEKK
jgi:hypothetical protein